MPPDTFRCAFHAPWGNFPLLFWFILLSQGWLWSAGKGILKPSDSLIHLPRRAENGR